MPLAEQLVHQRYVHPGPLVLRTAPLNIPAPATDRDRTVSRRSEPSSRTALSVERWHFHSHTTGSLTPTFVPARPVGLAVKLAYAFALYARFPSVLSQPLSASVTLLEATAPVKLPT